MDSHTLRNVTAAFVALLLLAAAVPAYAVPPVPPLVANGDFEDASISPWAGGAQLVDNSVWTPAGGHQSASLDNEAWIYQDIATTQGQRYDLSFAAAANPIDDGLTIGCSPGTKDMTVWWGDTAVAGYRFDTAGHTTTSMGWQTKHLLVDATAATTRLRIDDYLDPGCGIALDNVALTAPSVGQTGVQLTTPSDWTVYGEPLTMTATVLGSSANVTPTGSVQFEIDGVPTGAPVALQDGTAQVSVEGLERNQYVATATYTPDSASFNASAVSRRVSVLQAMTATGVSFDQSYVPVDQPVTVTASVGVFAPGTGTPTGTIQFSDEFGPLGGPVALEADGTAQIQVLEDVGDHVVYAWYSGDDARYTVSSGQGDLSVYDPNQVPDPPVTPPLARALTTTKPVSSSNPVAPGESFVVAATVAPSAASNAVPSGTIQFSVGTTAVGGPISLDPSQSASTTLTAPTTATRQTIRATYSGDANFRGSTGFLTQVTRAPTVTPTPPVVVSVPDKTPATFTLAPAGKRLATALRRGLRVHVACSENCSAVLRLLLRSHGKSVVVARGSKTSARTKAFDVVISFSPRYRRQLAKARRVTLRLSAAVKDAVANQSARAQNLTLKR